MKKRYVVVTGLVSFALGIGVIPTYKYVTAPEPMPVFVEQKMPALVGAEEIAAAVRADAFLVSSRSEVTARVTVRSGTDISDDAPTTGWFAWFRSWWTKQTARDRLTVNVTGEVLAGFDLRDIGTENITVNDTSEVVFDLGRPEFLGILNNEMATEFVSRNTGWFRTKDQTLYLAAQALGEPKIFSAACQEGALSTAGESGSEIMTRISNLMRAQGDNRRIRVIFTSVRCTSR